MKAEEIVVRLFENKRGVTPERIKKAQALAQRSNVTWDNVLSAMSNDQRQQLEGA